MQQQHQDTLQALFAHPIQRGIHLTRAIDLCRALGAEVSHLDQDRLKVQWAHGEETWLQYGSGPGKNELHPDALMRLRQLLVQQGISPDHPESFNEPERGDQSHRLVIRMDHRHCDIFHLVGTDVEHAVLRPHGLWGTGQRAPLDIDYLKRIEQAIEAADVVLLVGHGKGQSNVASVLLKHLEQYKPQLLERVTQESINDTNLSDDALLALARRKFGNLPHRHRLRIPGQPIQENVN
jgi:hypothetical protein